MDIKQRAKEIAKDMYFDGCDRDADLITDLLTVLESTEAERDRYMRALERIYDDGAEGCCTYCDIKADIAKEALAGGE